MTNAVFGELRKEDDYGWWGKQTLAFSGNTYTVDLLIHKDKEDEITKRQEEAFTCFMKEWPKLQEHLIEELIKYYNEYEYYSYGPEDEKELAEWWPEIKTKEALLQAVTLETIVVSQDYMMNKGRYIYLLFSRTWGGEDLDDNGIGVRYINEQIDEIAYKDMAF